MIASATVGTTETTIVPAPAAFPYRFVAIGNSGTATIYVKLTPDTTSVTTSNGIPLAPGASFVFDQPTVRLELFRNGIKAVATTSTSVAAQYF